MNNNLNLFESFKFNLNEQEKEELEDAKEALKNPNLKGDERTEYQHDVSRLENKPNLTEAYIEDEFDFSINTGVFDGDIPEIEKKYNLKIENITEPNAHHNPVYRVSGTKEDLINWIESEKLYDEDNYLEYIHESTDLNESDINSIIADKGILNELKQFEDKIIRDAFLNMCELEQISTKNQIQVFQECRRLSGQEPLSENNK